MLANIPIISKETIDANRRKIELLGAEHKQMQSEAYKEEEHANLID